MDRTATSGRIRIVILNHPRSHSSVHEPIRIHRQSETSWFCIFLNRYHVVYTDQLQDVAKAELRSAGSTLDTAVAGCFNLEQYGLDLLRNKGYTQTADGRAYILGPHAQIRAPMQMQQM